MYYTHFYGEIRKFIILLYMVFGSMIQPKRTTRRVATADVEHSSNVSDDGPTTTQHSVYIGYFAVIAIGVTISSPVATTQIH